MVIRDRYAVNMMKRRSRCVGCAILPIVGLCDIHIEDGKALAFPGSKRVCIRLHWTQFCQHMRRRNKMEQPKRYFP